MTAITFNGNSLQTSGIITSEIDHLSPDELLIDLYGIAHKDRNTIANTEREKRTVTISGQIVANTISELDTLLDTFKGYLVGREKNLDIGYAGSTRRYIATAKRPRIDRPGGLLYADFVVQFVCQPYGQDTTATEILNVSAQTDANDTHNITVGGTAEWQQLQITITLDSVTGGTDGTISVGNNDNGQLLNITADFETADVVVIDTYESSVTINGVEVESVGGFPEFEPGAGGLTYGDDFSARSYDMVVDQYKRYE